LKKFNKIQLLLILAGVVLVLGMYLAPRQASSEEGVKEEIEAAVEDNHDHEHQLEADKESSDPLENISVEIRNQLSELEEKASKIEDVESRLTLYDSLIAISIKNNIPPRVAKYSKEKARTVSTEINWMLAGDNYFKAFRLSKNTNQSMVEGAISCYEKVLEINPDNLDAETAIGVAYVEGAGALGQMPMKGIGILKEVLNKDPKNINALTNLGYFAIQSGQYEKAIERFNTVLEIDPNNAEAYIYLTDIYLSQDDIKKGIETLETYKSLVDDPIAKQQVDDYIKELKNK
jgi:tetratricopeptide (TPR) repeat protein